MGKSSSLGRHVGLRGSRNARDGKGQSNSITR